MGVANQRSIAWACVESFLLQPAKMDSLRVQHGSDRILACLPCDVTQSGALSGLFQAELPKVLQGRKIDCVVHSIAHARNIDRPLLETTAEDYLYAQHVSAFSFLQVVQEAIRSDCCRPDAAFVALSYLGAERAVPGYHVMGPAKAALESLVRGVALELRGTR
jgi:enoyl-[acyl-carrier protein] reductase I